MKRQRASAAMASLLVALGCAGVAQAGNPHGTPPGQAKKQDSAQQSSSAAGVKPGPMTQHDTSCNTGGGQGSSATCSSSTSSNPDSSKRYGNGKTAAQIANGRGAPAGTTIKGPGNSQPHKVCKNGHWVDVHAVKSYSASTSCTASKSSTASTSSHSSNHTSSSTSSNTSTTSNSSSNTSTGSNTAGNTSTSSGGTSPASTGGGVLGASKTLTRPAARGGRPSGTLGAGAVRSSATRATLPFTGLSLWLPLLVGVLLLGGGIALVRGARGTA